MPLNSKLIIIYCFVQLFRMAWINISLMSSSGSLFISSGPSNIGRRLFKYFILVSYCHILGIFLLSIMIHVALVCFMSVLEGLIILGVTLLNIK